MKTNQKIKAYEEAVGASLVSNIKRLNEEQLTNIEALKALRFTIFNNTDNPLIKDSLDIANTIFFTYCDHYSGNGGMSMSVGFLSPGHAHTNMDDRGYIKGVYMDLANFLKLRRHSQVAQLKHHLSFYRPKFNKGRNYDIRIKDMDIIEANALEALAAAKEHADEYLCQLIRELTGCSLPHYIRAI